MLEFNVTQILLQFFSWKVTYFKIAQKVVKYLGYFYKKFYCKELSKIAQSGHSVGGGEAKEKKLKLNSKIDFGKFGFANR